MRRSSRSAGLEGPVHWILSEWAESNMWLQIFEPVWRCTGHSVGLGIPPHTHTHTPWWLGVALPLHGGVTEWLLLLRQQVSDSHHADHSQSKWPNLKSKSVFYRKDVVISGSLQMRGEHTCTKTPGRKRCRIFSKISFWSTSHVTVRSKYRMKGLPNLQISEKQDSSVCSCL